MSLRECMLYCPPNAFTVSGISRLFILHQSWIKTVFSSIPNDLEILFSKTSSYDTNLKLIEVANLRYAKNCFPEFDAICSGRHVLYKTTRHGILEDDDFLTHWVQEMYKDVEIILWQLIKSNKKYVKSSEIKISQDG